MHDEVARVGAIDGGLGLGAPSFLGFCKVWEDTDNVERIDIAEARFLWAGQLAAEHEVEELRGLLAHDVIAFKV